MKKERRILRAVIALLLVSALMISSAPFIFFAAAEDNTYSEDDVLAQTGLYDVAHRSVSYDGLPDISGEELNKSIGLVFADSYALYLDIYEKHRMVISDAYSIREFTQLE